MFKSTPTTPSASRSSSYVQLADDWYQESASWTYPATGSSVLLTNAISRTRLTGLDTAFSANGATGILSAESVSIDARRSLGTGHLLLTPGQR